MNLIKKNFFERFVLNKKTMFCSRFFSTSHLSEVLVDNINNKKVLTLNREKKLNSLNISMIRELYAQLKEVNKNKSSDMVILKSNGRAFCAGGDVVDVSDSYKEGNSLAKDFFKEEYKLNYLMRTLKVPFVALINGITMGGGCGISVNGRFQVATEKTLLSMPETALGFFPDVGASFFLSRLKNELGMFLGLTGYKLRGADVYHAGLASHYALSNTISQLTDRLLNLTREECTDAVVDKILNEFKPNEVPPFTLESSLLEIRKSFHANCIEEIFENLQRSNSDFAKQQLKLLKKMSPTSLKVTFNQIKQGSTLSYAEVIPMELNLTKRFLQEHDFHEGVRALLKDKDQNPKWKPSDIKDVTNEKIDWYFASF